MEQVALIDKSQFFTFNHKKIPFLKEDITLLPLTNITVEELSRWFVNELIKNNDELIRHRIERLVVKVFSAPGQSASHTWARDPLYDGMPQGLEPNDCVSGERS